MLELGIISILDVDGIFRVKIVVHDNSLDDRLDQLEADGDTLEEALINLHAVVEDILA